MKTASKYGIIFDSSKCQIMQPQIASYGAVFTAKGMLLDPSKRQAIQGLPTPIAPLNLIPFWDV